MRLTRIEIENFKGIGKRQIIDLRPITLLFGPNSAGKSTILQALHYVREILERQNPDPDQIVVGQYAEEMFWELQGPSLSQLDPRQGLGSQCGPPTKDKVTPRWLLSGFPLAHSEPDCAKEAALSIRGG